MKSYLDITGLSYLWSKITYIFYKKLIDDVIYVGAGVSVNSVYNNDSCKIENFNRENTITVNCNSNYIFIVFKTSDAYIFNPMLNGLSIPVDNIDTTTISGYTIIKSKSAYTGTLNIRI